MKKAVLFLICISFLLGSLPFSSSADDVIADHSSTEIVCEGFDYPKYVTDEKENTYADSEGSNQAKITLSNPEGIAHIYVILDRLFGEWTIVEPMSGLEFKVGKNGFLHEYIDVTEYFGKKLRSVVLRFDSDAYVSEVYGFTDGTLPDWVQKWEPPLEKADILLLSSHSDDEQLFFAGVLPYYAGERGADVQVVYLINHFDTHDRPHEQLNGLWAVGIRSYPVISDFPDLYSESLKGAISAFEKKGYTYEDFTNYVVENIRRFKPQVLVTHDIEGEYGHGTHIYCTDVVMSSLDKTSDPSFCPESASQWGVWDVPKTYLHLYGENQITMDWDIPLEVFGGKTAFEMSVVGFGYHESQHWTWFNDWIHGKSNAPITKASEIKTYSPCKYGLYRTTVGNDVIGTDFLENIVTYKEQEPPETEAPETEITETAPPDTEDDYEHEEDTDSSENENAPPLGLLLGMIVGVCAFILIVYFLIASSNKNKK